jgi:hypothetical protein
MYKNISGLAPCLDIAASLHESEHMYDNRYKGLSLQERIDKTVPFHIVRSVNLKTYSICLKRADAESPRNQNLPFRF